MKQQTGTPSPEALRSLEALRLAVRDALERTRRPGQHAVVWRNSRVEVLDWREDSQEQADGPHNNPKS